jgi:hypothetical protein
VGVCAKRGLVSLDLALDPAFRVYARGGFEPATSLMVREAGPAS